MIRAELTRRSYPNASSLSPREVKFKCASQPACLALGLNVPIFSNSVRCLVLSNDAWSPNNHPLQPEALASTSSKPHGLTD